MNTSKLMLTILPSGILLGAVIAQMASPQMKFAEQPDWRSRYAPSYSSSPMQFVDALPEEVSPAWYGPSYIGPTTYSPTYAAPPDYASTADYTPPPLDETAPDVSLAQADVPDEADQASVEATETAAVLTEPVTPPTAPVLDIARPEPATSLVSLEPR
jgi:hypothetical protein